MWRLRVFALRPRDAAPRHFWLFGLFRLPPHHQRVAQGRGQARAQGEPRATWHFHARSRRLAGRRSHGTDVRRCSRCILHHGWCAWPGGWTVFRPLKQSGTFMPTPLKVGATTAGVPRHYAHSYERCRTRIVPLPPQSYLARGFRRECRASLRGCRPHPLGRMTPSWSSPFL